MAHKVDYKLAMARAAESIMRDNVVRHMKKLSPEEQMQFLQKVHEPDMTSEEMAEALETSFPPSEELVASEVLPQIAEN
jgi:hypothetical protein